MAAEAPHRQAGHVVVVAAWAEGRTHPEIRERLQCELRAARLPHASDPLLVAAVVAGHDAADAERRGAAISVRLRALIPHLLIGMSAAFEPDRLEHARREARRAVAFARLEPRWCPARITDFPLAEALNRISGLAEQAVAVLAPFRDRPEFLDTLAWYYAYDRDRRRVAHILDVHLRTVDYRLRRIHELTEIAPQSVRGAVVLGAALAVHHVGLVEAAPHPGDQLRVAEPGVSAGRDPVAVPGRWPATTTELPNRC